MKKFPLISVYWISGYRGDLVVRLAEELRARTAWPELELLVVDWSVGHDDLKTRDRISESGVFDRIFFRDRRYCVYNSTNFIRAKCSGDYIVGFEDDVRLHDGVPDTWLVSLLETMRSGNLDDLSLWSESCSAPPTLAYMSSCVSENQFPGFDCYPDDFSTISESMRSGASRFAEKYRQSGRRMGGVPIAETSLSAPSRNLAKLGDLAGYSWKKIDKLIDEGVQVERMGDVHFVSAVQYRDLGGWEAMKWEVLGNSRVSETARRRLSSHRLLLSFHRRRRLVKLRVTRSLKRLWLR